MRTNTHLFNDVFPLQFNEIVFTHMRAKALQTIEPVTYQAALSAVRQVEENVQFLTNHRDQLSDWFKENYPSSAVKLISWKSFMLSMVFLLIVSL